MLVVAAFSVLVGWAFDQGFAQYMNAFNDQRAEVLARDLGDEYREDGSWEGLIRKPQRWAELAMVAAGHTAGDLNELQAMFSQFKGNEFPDSIPPPLPLRFVLFDAQGRVIIGNPRPDAQFRRWKIEQNGAVVGQLGYTISNATPYDLQFRKRFLTALAVIIAGSVLLATLPAFFIARFVTRPVGAIGRAARNLAAGNAVGPLRVESSDELGDLARDFNELSDTLQRNQNLQRQWLAEISHELRTPVAILMAETEAVIDGVRKPSPAGFKSLHDEAGRLSRLIDDLHQLSLLDGGIAKLHPVELRLADLLHSCVAAEQTRFDLCRITVGMTVSSGRELRMIGDEDKLRQVFMNLFENSLRYTDAGGEVRINIERTGDIIHIRFEDSSPGVPASEVRHLFERLYRGESSRSRASGGAGLGLAIVKSIVTTHGGTIAASLSPLGGVRFDIEFEAVG